MNSQIIDLHVRIQELFQILTTTTHLNELIRNITISAGRLQTSDTYYCNNNELEKIMGQPAARITDIHLCPMVIPAPVPVPHVGGPITGPGSPITLIGMMPAARATDTCVCVGPPDMITKGSATVLIGKMPAARMGDLTAHGGTIGMGCPTVLIGG